MAGRHGFTLLELLIAVSLAAVLTGTALFGYQRMLAGWRLDAARAGMGVKDLPDPNTAYIDFLSFMSQIKPPSTKTITYLRFG